MSALDLGGHFVTPAAAPLLELARLLAKIRQLEKLDLRSTGLGAKGMRAIADDLKGPSRLRSLDLDFNYIEDVGESGCSGKWMSGSRGCGAWRMSRTNTESSSNTAQYY